MAQGRAFAGRADGHQAVGALGDLPVHQAAEGRLVERAVLEWRDQGGERSPELCLGCHGLPPTLKKRHDRNWISIHIGSGDQAKGPYRMALALCFDALSWRRPSCPPQKGREPRFCRGDGANRCRPRRFSIFVHIFSQIDLRLERLNDSPPQRNAVIPSARAAALRSTALATSLALAVGLAAIPLDAWAKPKVPLPKPRPIARNVVPKPLLPSLLFPSLLLPSLLLPSLLHTPARPPPPIPRRQPPLRQRPRPLLRRHCSRPQRVSMPPCRHPRKTRGAGSGCRDVHDVAGRQGRAGKRHRAGAQAEARGCNPGAGRDIGSGRPQACGMADPAQRQQRRFRRALPRVCLGQSELAVANLPAPAHRGSALGRPPRRRRPSGPGSKTNRRSRPRASSRWRRP